MAQARKNYTGRTFGREGLTGQPAPSYVNAAMQHGIDNEQAAADAYEFERNVDLTTARIRRASPRVPMSWRLTPDPTSLVTRALSRSKGT